MADRDQTTSRYVGFDAPTIREMIRGMRSAAAAASPLHRDVSSVLEDAGEQLLDKPPTTSERLQRVSVSLFGMTLNPPGSLEGPLDEIAASTTRRCDQLEAMQDLEFDGISVDPSLVFADEPPPDRSNADDVLAKIRALDGKDFGTNGNRDDLRTLAADLEGLSAVELEWVLGDLSDDDRRMLGDLINGTGDSRLNPFDENGLPQHERLALAGVLLGKSTPARWDALIQIFPGVQPPFDAGDDNKKGVMVDGVRWGVPDPPMPLFLDGVSADDINQGAVGDCWFLSAVTGVAGRDPQSLQEGIKENPNGTISVRLYDSEGNEHWVTVTPELPLDEDGNPAGVSSNGELWVAYYEKAFAAFYDQDNDGLSGSYKAIEGDYTDKAGPYLTGRPADEIDADFDDVREKYDQGEVVIVGSPGEKKVEDKFKDGYVTGHAYVVDGFTDDGKIILRNPWGTAYPKLVMTPDEFERYFNSAGSFATRD
jgi:hypothetical protein